MYNNTVIAILEKAGLITHEAAEVLAKELVDKIHPARYADAMTMVESAVENVKQVVAEPWLGDIARLEGRIKNLEGMLSPFEAASYTLADGSLPVKNPKSKAVAKKK